MYASKLLDSGGEIITCKKLLEEFYQTGKDTSEYEAFRQEYINQGYSIIDDEEE